MRTAVVLILFAAVFLTLSTVSFTRTSATSDEPYHLTTGYTALIAGDYRTDPEHPPLVRMWAALPLFFQEGIKSNTEIIDHYDPSDWIGMTQAEYAHVFMYQMNDADRMLYPARFMMALLGVLLGVILFFWARELLGFWPAVIALGCYMLEPNILAQSSLVTTDIGVTCFLFASVYFLWRTCRRLTMLNVVGLALFSALAIVSKYSAIILAPILLALILIHALRPAVWECRFRKHKVIRTRVGRIIAGGALAIFVGLVSWASIWAVYDFRYLPSATPGWRSSFDADKVFCAPTPLLAEIVHWVDSNHLLPNAYSEGFLLGQVKMGGRASFLAGKISTQGWWYYFPFAFLIKTPLSLVLLFLGGLITCAARWREVLSNAVFMLVPVGIFMLAAMISMLNIGVRHILPIFPFVFLLAAFCASEMIRARRKIAVAILCLLGALWLFEFARVYPHNLAFFNSIVGGPRNGFRYLEDSNIDWGQDLKQLKKWMDENRVQEINLAYFGPADPSYYGMRFNRLVGSTQFVEDQLSPPKLPGYVAISTMVLTGVVFKPAYRDTYKSFLDREPVAVIGHSIRVYWVDRPWW